MCSPVALVSISRGACTSTSAVQKPLSSSYDTSRGPAPESFHFHAYIPGGHGFWSAASCKKILLGVEDNLGFMGT